MIPQLRSMTVGELRESLDSFPDYARVEVMVTHSWQTQLHGVAASTPSEGRFERVFLLTAGATPHAARGDGSP